MLDPFAFQISCIFFWKLLIRLEEEEEEEMEPIFLFLDINFVLNQNAGHVSFIKDIAATKPPQHLEELLKVLHTRGEGCSVSLVFHGPLPYAILI